MCMRMRLLLQEELAYGCSGIATAMEANALAEAPLLVAASDDIKKRFLGRMTEAPLQARTGLVMPVSCISHPLPTHTGVVCCHGAGRGV